MKFGYDSDFSFSGITEDDVTEWETLYPSVVIQLELGKAGQWLKANPAKRKKNIYGFLCRWLEKTQESGGTRTPSNRPANGQKYRTQSVPVTD